jgi:hypothetical protein
MIILDNTGEIIRAAMRDPIKAKTMVIASGLKSFPSIPWRENMGRNTMMIIATENRMGLRT